MLKNIWCKTTYWNYKLMGVLPYLCLGFDDETLVRISNMEMNFMDRS